MSHDYVLTKLFEDGITKKLEKESKKRTEHRHRQ